MRIVEREGASWIDHPTNIEVSKLYERIENGEGVDSIKNTLSITDPNHWHTVADAIFDYSKTQDINPVGAGAQIDKINDALAPHALNVSVYGNVAEEKELIRLIDTPIPDIQAASRIVFRAVMDPRMRALQLAGRFEKIPLFREFSYFINSATISYYRGNVVSALLCLVPVIEGILIRWQGFPGRIQTKPNFDKTKNFVRKSIYRNPAPFGPVYFETYVKAADSILRNHFYLYSGNASGAYDGFNRHLASHMLDNTKFYSHENVMRTFLLLDLLSEIYHREKRQYDPRFSTQDNEYKHFETAYLKAISEKTHEDSPEKILFKHSEHIDDSFF